MYVTVSSTSQDGHTMIVALNKSLKYWETLEQTMFKFQWDFDKLVLRLLGQLMQLVIELGMQESHVEYRC